MLTLTGDLLLGWKAHFRRGDGFAPPRPGRLSDNG